MNRFLRSLVDGALGGVAGTIAMSAVVAAARALGVAHPTASRRAWTKALSLAHLDRFGRQDFADRLGGVRGTAEHLGVGLGLGVVFGGLAFATRSSKVPTPVQGAIFGGLVFAAHRLGLVPAPSFLDPDDVRAPLDAPASLAAHLAFGAAVGVVVARLGAAETESPESADAESATAESVHAPDAAATAEREPHTPDA
jgi:hypothetical protein